jgi:hypothetical protein
VETDVEETEAHTRKKRKYRTTANVEPTEGGHQNVERQKSCDIHEHDAEETKVEASNIPRKSDANITLAYKARLTYLLTELSPS